MKLACGCHCDWGSGSGVKCMVCVDCAFEPYGLPLFAGSQSIQVSYEITWAVVQKDEAPPSQHGSFNVMWRNSTTCDSKFQSVLSSRYVVYFHGE